MTVLLILLRLVLPGLALSQGFVSRDRVSRGARRVGILLLLGLSANLIPVLLLGLFDVFTPGLDWLCWGLVTGICWAWKGRAVSREDLRLVWRPLLAWALGLAALLTLPHRGEWLPGGWDPGVYTNEGIALSRTGSLRPDDTWFHALPLTEKLAFLRDLPGRIERFPGVVVDPTRAPRITFEFMRLFPCTIAWLHRLGGMDAALRANHLLGWMLVWLWAGWLAGERRFLSPWFGTVLLLVQPVFLQHVAFPVTEPLHLLLLVGAVQCLAPPVARPGFFGLFLLLAVLNRYSFLPFGGLLLLGLSLCLPAKPAGRTFAVLLSGAGALAAGGVLNALWVAPVSPAKWSASDTVVQVCLLACLGSLLILGARMALRGRAVLRWLAWALPWGIAATLIALLWLMGSHALVSRPDEADNLARFLPFVGAGSLLLAGGGVWVLAANGRRLSPGLTGFLLMCLGASLILFYRKWTVDWYPWANRRFLPYAVPAVLLSATAFLTWLSRMRWPWTALVGLVLAGGFQAETAKRAFRYTEYNGVQQALNAVSAQLGPRDVVVVDDPMWGTPLALTYGHRVLNGKKLGDPALASDALSAFRRLQRSGYRVRFLTSVDGQMGHFAGAYAEGLRPDWEGAPLETQKLVQHPRIPGYELDGVRREFRLFTLPAE